MKAAPQGSDEQKVKQAETEINEIYSRIKAGESFSRLASELSDHRESAKKGGEMNWFGTGEIISDFAEPAFAIKDTGDYTKPVRTAYGYHIIKLLERKPQIPWDEIKPVYKARINQADIDAASSEKIRKYEDSDLENKYPDFRYLMAEFHDGILLFDISSDKIWHRIQDDTAGLRIYYQSNRDKFLSLKSIEGRLYILKDKTGEKKLTAAFRKFGRLPDCNERMQSEFNTAKDTLLVISEGKWYAGNDPEIDALAWKPGIHRFVRDGFPAAMKIEKVNEPVPLRFNEVQAEVISGYQDWLTDKWVKQLKEKYYVKVDSAVYEEVRKELADN
jgi:peptidyl-prolyl cis-trans isomerase SurA